MYYDDDIDKNDSTYPIDCQDMYCFDDSYLLEIKKKQDEFLDTYSHYLKNKNNFTKHILERKVIELELIDPNFDFTID